MRIQITPEEANDPSIIRHLTAIETLREVIGKANIRIQASEQLLVDRLREMRADKSPEDNASAA